MNQTSTFETSSYAINLWNVNKKETPLDHPVEHLLLLLAVDAILPNPIRG